MSLNTTFVYQINVGELAFILQAPAATVLTHFPKEKPEKIRFFNFSNPHSLKLHVITVPRTNNFRERLKTINHVKIYLPTLIKRLISPKEN